MPRLVESLDDWSAVRLGAQGTLFLLAQDKQLAQTLALLPSFRAALERRGLKPSARADRDFQWKDIGRGLARAGADALSSTSMSADAAAFDFSVILDAAMDATTKKIPEVEVLFQ